MAESTRATQQDRQRSSSKAETIIAEQTKTVDIQAPQILPVREVIARLVNYLQPHKLGWLTAIVTVLMATLATSIALRLIQPLLDTATEVSSGQFPIEDGQRLIAIYLFYMGLFTVIGVLLMRQGRIFVAKLAQRMMLILRRDYYASLVRQQAGFFGQYDTGKLLSVGINDAEVVGVFFTQQIPFLLVNVGQLILALFFMVQLSWQLALVSIVLVVALQALSLRVIAPRMQTLAAHYREELANVNSRLNENLAGIRDIQVFSQENRTIGQFSEALKVMGNYMVRSMNLTMTNVAIFYLLSGLGITLVYGIGALGTTTGQIEIGFVVSFAAFFAQFVTPITALSGAMVSAQSMLVAARRMFELMEVEPAIQDRPNAIDPGPLKGHIKFEDVSFSYNPNDPESWQIENVNLEIKPGEKVAFVGGSGSGKSTLVGLVGRFFDVTSGRVTIDGYDVRDLTIESLRRNLGMVSQNVVLFQGTLADNIRFARPDATMHEVREAAEIGYVDTFVDQLEHGYDTLLGPMGQGLSGGQKQRVSIARAALAQAPILVLDEATSALDNTSELAVTRALDNLTRHSTTLNIAHRLDTIINSDKIVVLSTDEHGNGVVKAIGRHDDLLSTSDDYGALYRHKLKNRGILMPIGPLYNTTPILPTVVGISRSFAAPVYLLDFGPVTDEDRVDNDRFGIEYDSIQTSIRDIPALNRQHVDRVDEVVNLMRQEGVVCQIIHADPQHDWIEATLDAILAGGITHVVAMDNVLVPLEDLRRNIRFIERKAHVEYILVDPFIAPPPITIQVKETGTQTAAPTTTWDRRKTIPNRQLRRAAQARTMTWIQPPVAEPAPPLRPKPKPISQLNVIQSLVMFLWPTMLFLTLFYLIYPVLTTWLGMSPYLAFLLLLMAGHGTELGVGLMLALFEGLPLRERLRFGWPKDSNQWLGAGLVAAGLALVMLLVIPLEQVFWDELILLPYWWPDLEIAPAWATVLLAQLVTPLFIVLGEGMYYRGYLLPKMNATFGRADWGVNALMVIMKNMYQPWLAFTPSNLLGVLAFSWYAKQRQLWISLGLHYLVYLLLLLSLAGVLG